MPHLPIVVVADDSAVSRSLVLQALAGLPLRAVEADSGNAAIRAINRNKPALLILDICMPYPDGLTLLKMVRQDAEFEDLPVIICSVENGLMERAEAETFGISGFLNKPIDLKLLREMVALTLDISPEVAMREEESGS